MQLYDTTLDPEKRTLLRIKISDLERDMRMLKVLHDDKNEFREERKRMMSKFKLDKEDIDN